MTLLLAAALNGWIIFGDSLCSNGWPEILTRYPAWNETSYIQNHCQGGLTMMALDIPEHITASGLYRNAFLALGSNDAYREVDIEAFTEAAQQHIDTLQAKGFRVVCLIPPVFDVLDTSLYRSALMEICPEAWDAPHDPGPDGIHLSSWGTLYYALFIFTETGADKALPK